ncbi:formylglycine-generating enzyme family protein [Kiritimatiellota bacterium B12222]|nr:formylglycine-generating enzyme family protein [Kiritimatiellota bacterium B12222]
MMKYALTVCLGLMALVASAQKDTPQLLIPAGTFIPLMKDMDPVPVEAFRLDVHAVTNADYLAFVTANPQWQKGKVPRILADAGYLRNWTSPLLPGDAAPPQAPVTSVSWHAARAYAEWKGLRLPTLAEWEVAAALLPESTTRQQILSWYAKPLAHPLPAVQSTQQNTSGIWDLHGLIWEWCEDYDSLALLSRAGSDESLSALFCGGAAAGAADPSDYAAFLRYAFRGSLSASHTVAGLGFRCASTLPEPPL